MKLISVFMKNQFPFLLKVKMVFSCGCSEAGKLGIIKIFGKNN